MKIRNTTHMAFVIGALLTTEDCFAALATNTFRVTATVTNVCTVSATDLAFGNYASSGRAVDSTNTVNVVCNSGTPYTITLSTGNNTPTYTPRFMEAGGQHLSYNIYTDAARTQIWGDGTGGTFRQRGTGNGVNQQFIGYGRIPLSQSLPAGNYADLITTTVTY